MRNIVTALLTLALIALPTVLVSAPGGAPVTPRKKTSLEEIGVEGRKTLRRIGQSYGMEICGDGFIKDKDEIKKKAWSRIQQKCSKFTLKVMNSYQDEPNALFSLCIGGSLYGCQKAIDVAYPCDDLPSCKDYLGVPWAAPRTIHQRNSPSRTRFFARLHPHPLHAIAKRDDAVTAGPLIGRHSQAYSLNIVGRGRAQHLTRVEYSC